MTIGAVGSYYFTPYMSGMNTNTGMTTEAQANAGAVMGTTGVSSASEAESTKPIVNPGESTEIQPGKKSSPAECETCKERKYQDGSDEMVSFKSASHISPEAAGSRVRAHEQEHVSNAYSKAAKGNGKVMQASVAIKTAICPECGRSYVSGGTTTTKIQYPADKFSQNKKSMDRQAVVGGNFDAAV